VRVTDRRHVVVVDDDALIRTLMTAFLAKLGCRSTICPDGATASAALAEARRVGDPVHVVVIDLHLGGVNGSDVCRRLRGEGVDASIVCMSGDIGAIDRRGLEEAGFDGALTKPLSLAELEATIGYFADRKHAPPST
jgi:DNA-binding response OmpR family regulator